jgi:hypothetical protein
MWGVEIISIFIMYIAVHYALYVYERDEKKKG